MQFMSFGFGRSPQAIVQVGEYRGADFNQLACAAVARHNLGIGKGHKIKDWKPHRLYIRCSRGDECAFLVNALLVDGVGLRILKFQGSNTVRAARCGKGK